MSETTCADAIEERELLSPVQPPSTGPAETTPELVAGVRNTLVEHPAFAAGIAAIQRCHRMGRFGLEEPGCLLVTGVSGSGKSTLRKEYVRHHPRRETEEGTEIPVLDLELPAQPTIKNVAERILLELGDPLFTRGSAEAMTSRIVTLFRNCHVELVILDEFQHFIDHSSEKIETRVADWLKHLVNITRVPFVLMGLHRCRRILQSNEQLRRRFSRQIALEPFANSDKRSRRIFDGLMRSIWTNLPVPPAPQLVGDGDHLDRIHFATYGLMGYIMMLVSTSVEIALDEKRPCIDQDILSQAFVESIWPDARGHLNPFHPRFICRPLTNAGEPFFGYTR
ncbi:TniB family NTP-binding protein [Burkholderia vietnamiensis]|uniref:TniB family NTP-binding protein n=1 Tax=Burkholderia vietnamiensis TaxID=60552 RepID=UPI001B8E0D45|nr:TniB family NTP-binding protein [Burkholderia vietnamiensis]MBR8010404.1 TniB family NTP-binding protein [Burkholderia vietnamiensis]HDR9135006.1 TniB family NTP-binding protein [Burkholderia vietnamiensis]